MSGQQTGPFANQNERKAFFKYKKRQRWQQTGQARTLPPSNSLPTTNVHQAYNSADPVYNLVYKLHESSAARYQSFLESSLRQAHNFLASHGIPINHMNGLGPSRPPPPATTPPPPTPPPPPPPGRPSRPSSPLRPSQSTQYQFHPVLSEPDHAPWVATAGRVNSIIHQQYYPTLEFEQTSPQNEIFGLGTVRCHEIEDEEDGELKLKRKALPDKVHGLKKAKLDQVPLTMREKTGKSVLQVASESRHPDNTAATKPQNNKVASPHQTAPLPAISNPPSETRRHQRMSTSTPSTSKPGSINGPPSSITSLDDDAALRRSRENDNREALARSIESGKRNIENPLWKEYGHMNDDYACLTEEIFREFRPTKRYSVQLMVAWRASIQIPDNWVVLVPDEMWKNDLMSKDTTDVIQVNYEASRLHFTMTHLSIRTWRAFYYDSYLWQHDAEAKDLLRWRWCDQLVKKARLNFPRYEITIPSSDPLMSSMVSQVSF